MNIPPTAKFEGMFFFYNKNKIAKTIRIGIVHPNVMHPPIFCAESATFRPLSEKDSKDLPTFSKLLT